MSSLLFNTGLQSASEDDLRILREKGMGDQQCDCLSNSRSTDDVLLFSSSLNQLKKMMSDFKRSTEKVGLKIHPDRTKILGNQKNKRQTEATVDNIRVENLPPRVTAKYLGQTIMFEQ